VRDLRTELGQSDTPILFAGELDALETLKSQSSGNVYLVTPFVKEPDTERAKAFVKRFKDAYEEEPDVHAALAYEAAQLLFEGIRRTQAAAGNSRLRDELADLKDFAGLAGPLSFDEERRLRRAAYVVRIDEGKATTVRRFGPDEL
jgi:branched-chain amino acid transport system substrate-binding protein